MKNEIKKVKKKQNGVCCLLGLSPKSDHVTWPNEFNRQSGGNLASALDNRLWDKTKGWHNMHQWIKGCYNMQVTVPLKNCSEGAPDFITFYLQFFFL